MLTSPTWNVALVIVSSAGDGGAVDGLAAETGEATAVGLSAALGLSSPLDGLAWATGLGARETGGRAHPESTIVSPAAAATNRQPVRISRCGV